MSLLMELDIDLYLDFTLRLVLACACGALIGFERTKRFKEAGLRTHIIVCLAAALMMIVSKYGFADLANGTNFIYGTHGTDPARIAAQVISGISFLGAGIIFHNNNSVRGLTTAAGIWATAGIGLALGAGMYYLGIFVTIVVAVVQLFLYKYLIGADGLKTNQITFSVINSEEVRKAVKDFFDSLNVEVMETKIEYDANGYANYNITVRTNKQITIDEVNEMLMAKGEVKQISVVVLKS
ncbi:MAG: MgtC/SapB family protein [Lachnospiraceae bacterium]|nr:MgtC/SapB family protein [Lachnospiraceae bacterium]